MRVLHLTPELPYETGGGGRGREYFLCKRLVELGHEVLNISPVVREEAHWADALPEAGAENWVAVRPASQLREAIEGVAREPEVLATAVVAPVRALEMRIFWTRLRPLVDRAVREWRPDVVVVGHDMAASWAEAVPATIPAVLTLHNLTWHWYLSRARRSRWPVTPLLRAEAARYRRFVLRRFPRFSAAVAVSTIEAEEVRGATTLPVHVIPTGVDTQKIRPGPEPEGPPRLLFAGTLGYPPNSEGVTWFVERVWPEVRRTLPDARLDIAGRNPPPQVVALGDRDGITVIGAVPEMEPYFARAHAVIVPILTGAGMRVKIVDAMANGRAIVSTSLGWEGLPHVEPDRQLLVADEPADFAVAALRLLRDPELRSRLAADGRATAERHYDWRGLGDQQEQVLHDAVDARRSAADRA